VHGQQLNCVHTQLFQVIQLLSPQPIIQWGRGGIRVVNSCTGNSSIAFTPFLMPLFRNF
jgi:hypothetical protein